MEKRYRAKQASDSLLVGALLSVSGGLQDAYTYNVRDQVFANAQTGNIVLLGQNLMLGNWGVALRYLMPLIAFAGGVYMAEVIHNRFRTRGVAMHWRHAVLIVEIAILLGVAWMPQSLNLPANMLVSFVCAMQVEAFRELEGSSYATTMCIGNLRSAMENLYYWRKTGEDRKRHKALTYLIVIVFFLIGAATGGVLSASWGEMTILLCCPPLLLAFVLMLRIRERHLRFLSLMTGAVEDEAVVKGELNPESNP